MVFIKQLYDTDAVRGSVESNTFKQILGFHRLKYFLNRDLALARKRKYVLTVMIGRVGYAFCALTYAINKICSVLYNLIFSHLLLS